MTIRNKLLFNIGLPLLTTLIISFSLILFITTNRISKEIESSIQQQNNSIVTNVSNIVSNSAKSYLLAISDLTKIDTSILDNITNKNFLSNGYIYIVNKQGYITYHPDRSKIGEKSINSEWLTSNNVNENDFYKYDYEGREKLLYKYFNSDINKFVLTTAYIDDFSESINMIDLRVSMKKIKIGKTGYPIILTQEGLCQSHPEPEYIESNILDYKDADGNYIFKRIVNELNGNFKYNAVSSSGENRKKIIYFNYDKNSKLIVCTTGYIDEYYETVTTTFKMFLISFISVVILTFFTFIHLSKSFLKPIESLSKLSIEITKGNHNQQFINSNMDEINTLGKNFLSMQDSIRDNLNNLEEAIQRKATELQDAQDNLIQSEKMSSLGGLVAGVAHEINTPIGIGVTVASHLEKETADFKEKYTTGKMTKSSFEKYMENTKIESKILLSNMNRAATLVQSFKMVSVDQATELNRHFYVKEYIEELLVSLNPKIKSKRINITIDCNNEMVINSYPGALSQILTNLILNSFLHAFENLDEGEITISIILNNDILQLIYSDNGIGISEEYKDKIFDPFFTTKRNKGGTGLGLHIVYNLVNTTLNGSIKHLDQEEIGSTFSIVFPVMA